MRTLQVSGLVHILLVVVASVFLSTTVYFLAPSSGGVTGLVVWGLVPC